MGCPTRTQEGALGCCKSRWTASKGCLRCRTAHFPSGTDQAPPRRGDWWSYLKGRTRQIKKETRSTSRLRGGGSTVEVWRYTGPPASHLTIGSLIMVEGLGSVSPKGLPHRQRTLDRHNQTWNIDATATIDGGHINAFATALGLTVPSRPRILISIDPPSSFGTRVRNRPQGRFQCFWALFWSGWRPSIPAIGLAPSCAPGLPGWLAK